MGKYDELMERLRRDSQDRSGSSIMNGCVDCGLSANDCDDAATAIAEIIEQSLGPDWTARDAAKMIMEQLSDIGLQYADTVAISIPNEPGSFKGDIWFGHPEKRTLGTHRWDGCQWKALPSELDSCLHLLAQAQDRNEQLASFLADCPARHSMHGCPAYRPEPRHD